MASERVAPLTKEDLAGFVLRMQATTHALEVARDLVADQSQQILDLLAHIAKLESAAAQPTAEAYFLSQDGDAHWYLVPLARKTEWEAWQHLDRDDEASWDVPDFAREVGGAVSRVTFTSPEIA